MKKVIRLNEKELNQLISESVRRVLNENVDEGRFGNLLKTAALGTGLALGGLHGAHAQQPQQMQQQPQKIFTSYIDAGHGMKYDYDTVRYNDFTQMNQNINSQLAKFVKNGKMIESNKDLKNFLSKKVSSEGIKTHYSGIIGEIKYGCTKLEIANYIQSLGFAGLETGNNVKLAIIQNGNTYYIIVLTVGNLLNFDMFY